VGVFFLFYPAIRPFSDEASLGGAQAFASNAWLIAHSLAMVAFILLVLGLFGLWLRLRTWGLEMAGSALVHEVIDGKFYWTSPDEWRATGSGPVAHLLPDFDEYVVAYRDRSAALERADRSRQAPLPPGDALMLGLTVNGQVMGGWKLLNQGRRMVLELRLFGRLDEPETLAARKAATGLERFLGQPLDISGL
jgi:hypothetical protein